MVYWFRLEITSPDHMVSSVTTVQATHGRGGLSLKTTPKRAIRPQTAEFILKKNTKGTAGEQWFQFSSFQEACFLRCP